MQILLLITYVHLSMDHLCSGWSNYENINGIVDHLQWDSVYPNPKDPKHLHGLLNSLGEYTSSGYLAE